MQRLKLLANVDGQTSAVGRTSACSSSVLEGPYMFIDYYEILEISPNANSETIERVFRYLAMRYHPDNQDTGDLARFSEIVDANNTLKDPVKRAQYDIQYKSRSGFRTKL